MEILRYKGLDHKISFIHILKLTHSFKNSLKAFKSRIKYEIHRLVKSVDGTKK